LPVPKISVFPQSVWKNIGLCIGSLVLTLFVLEIGLRLWVPLPVKKQEEPKTNWALVPDRIWTEHHSVLGWYNQKNKRAHLETKHIDVFLHTNSQGFRGQREYEQTKPASVLRVVSLGDSFTFGWGVSEEETYSAKLEAVSPMLEVPNLGVVGYGVDQILMIYRSLGRDLEGDYVLVAIFPEDFWRATRSFSDTGHAKPYFSLSSASKLVLHNVPVPPPFQLKTNQFPDLLEYRPLEAVLMNSALYRALKRGILRLGKNLGWVDPNSTEEWILGRVILRTLIEEIKGSGAEPLIIIAPPDRWIRDRRVVSLRKSILRFGKVNKVEILDLTPHFQEAVQTGQLTDYYIQGDWHWTPQGHELAAKLILEKLTQRGLKLDIIAPAE